MGNENNSFFRLLTEAQNKFGSKKLFFSENENGWEGISLDQHIALVQAVQTWFKSLKLTPGQKLFLMAENSHQWQVIEHASFLYGLKLIAIEPMVSKAFLAEVIQNEKLDLVITGTSIQQEMIQRSCQYPVESAHLIEDLKSLLTVSESTLHIDASKLSHNPVFEGSTQIFTSGTTGKPKAYMYRAPQIIDAVLSISADFDLNSDDERALCWLPQANLFQRIFNLVSLEKGVPTFFLSSPIKITRALPQVGPTILIVVPHFVEKIMGGAKKIEALFPQFLQKIGRKLSQKIIAKKLGGSIKYMISGSAKCDEKVLQYFEEMGSPILEAYGLSECVTPVAMNTPKTRKNGTVGKVLNCNDIKISDAGELFLKSSGVTRSVRPDLNEYVSTGDLVEMDSEGYLKVLGRANDTVKTSTGRKVPLNKIDKSFSQLPHSEFVVAVAENRPFVTLIIESNDSLDTRKLNEIKNHIREVNAQLPKHEKVKAVVISSTPINIESGLLTRTLKINRKQVEKANQDNLQSVYTKTSLKASQREDIYLVM